jgi:putative ABC transport system permease protein
MFRHMLKLAWKRKSRNIMLTLEILLAFVIVFAIAAFATRSLQLYRLPIGFQYQDVWTGQLRMPDDTRIEAAVYDSFKRSLEAMPEVEAVAFSNAAPFTNATWGSGMSADNNKLIMTDLFGVSDGFFAVTGMKVEQGRVFSAEDDGSGTTPVLLNRRLAGELFPGANPIGKTFKNGIGDNPDMRTMKVVGLVEEFRNKGEFMVPVNMMIERFVPDPKLHGARAILLRLKAGTPRSFEQALTRQLKLVRNDWSYEIAPLSELRHAQLRGQLVPLVLMSVVACFLLVMVAFGLFGVLWQNTTRRIPEIGLRRALGASAVQIYGQIIAEQMLLSTAAMLLALVLLVQLPITGALGDNMNWPVFFGAAALSMGVIYLISLLCSLYPGWRASRLNPAEALHYE